MSPAVFIKNAVFQVTSSADFRLFPSSHGDFMVLFRSALERNLVLEQSPVYRHGFRVVLFKPKDTRDRFRVDLDWLVAISATHFLVELWNPDDIPWAFSQLGPVVEIDRECLTRDFSAVRVILARMDTDGIPPYISMANREGLGASFQIEVLHIWRREEQLDGNGRYRMFFPSNRPGNAGPGTGNAPGAALGGNLTFNQQAPHGNGLGPFVPAGSGINGFMGRPLMEWRQVSGFNSIYFGVVRPFPLQPLRRFPIIIKLSGLSGFVPGNPVLPLPWHNGIIADPTPADPLVPETEGTTVLALP